MGALNETFSPLLVHRPCYSVDKLIETAGSKGNISTYSSIIVNLMYNKTCIVGESHGNGSHDQDHDHDHDHEHEHEQEVFFERLLSKYANGTNFTGSAVEKLMKSLGIGGGDGHDHDEH